MSRYIIRSGSKKVAYGFDHAVGYFYQEFNADGECVVDRDSLFSGLSNSEFAELLKKNGAKSQHIHCAVLDLPF